MNILLVGNPNVGKSVVFSRLTGARVIASNYPGTTIEFMQGKLRLVKGQGTAQVIDTPGTYSLAPTCKAEEVACRMVKEGDLIINVINVTNLERNLNLTLQLIKLRKPMLIALNLWDEARHFGIAVDRKKLEELLGIPCIPTCAITGEGIDELVARLPEATVSQLDYEEKERWHRVGDIVHAVQQISHRHHSFRDILGDISVHPVGGIFIAVLVLAASFSMIRLVGESLINYIFNPLFNKLWTPLMWRFSGLLGSKGFIHDLLIGTLINGQIDFVQSLGLLTTGLYVPLGMVLPYVFAFYLLLSFLEDSGYLPRLGVLLDTFMHRMGLHGLSIIPMFLAAGCNVPGALATRILETKRERFIAATLMSIAIPCAAQSAVIVGLVGKHGLKGVGVVFLVLFIIWIVLGLLLKRFTRGESPEIFMEVPAYQIPRIGLLLKKTGLRVKWFLSEALPFVLAGVLMANLLFLLKITNFIGVLARPVMTGILGLPAEAVGAMIIGFFRKDVAVGMLAPLGLSLKQLVIASVVLTMYFPCIATFVVLLKELGIKYMAYATLIMIGATLVVGGILNLLL